MEQGKRGGGEDGVREVHLKKKKVGNNMSKCTDEEWEGKQRQRGRS